MRKALIISPNFPPNNAADMQRIRMSLPYFEKFGWQVEIVTVDPKYSEFGIDPFLSESVPDNIPIHYVNAFRKSWTRAIGFGNIAYRSLYFYRKYVDRLLENKQFDLIYFSTTQFAVCTLGAHWKHKFGIPYVIDFQDLWHSEYYKSKPRSERPSKYWLSYPLNKRLESLAMKHADGVISVSAAYITALHQRYANLKTKPAKVITFGAFDRDFEIVNKHKTELNPAYKRSENTIHLVYIGRGGFDMQVSLRAILLAFKQGLADMPALFGRVKFHFIGTSYAPDNQAKKTLLPVGIELDLEDYIDEQTKRISFYQGLRTLQEADGLIILGSDDPNYTASKIYPYILAKKPLLGIFNPESSAAKIINSCQAGVALVLTDSTSVVFEKLKEFISDIGNKKSEVKTDWKKFECYSAETMALNQTDLFNEVVA